MLQGTRKKSCSAHIRIVQFTLFVDYQVTSVGLSLWKLRQLRELKLAELKKELEQGTPNTKSMYFVSLPTNEAHSNHPTGSEVAFAQRVHPLLIAKINDLVSSNICNVHEVKKILRYYTNNELAKELGFAPNEHDRAFHPDISDIKNHVHKAKRALELSKIDQENLRLKVNKWQSSDPDNKFFFRPYIEKSEHDTIKKGACTSVEPCANMESNKTEVQLRFHGNSGEDDEWCEVLGCSEECSQSLLYVHQTSWQKRLLERYGNTICLLDATYKTTQYDLALFFVCIKTNVGYMVVAEFITQSEDADHISEALKQLQSWNPTWKPKFFMTDYSDAELLAIEQCFPGIMVYLCDFHREQCWERWTNKHKIKESKERLLSLLRSCANAPPSSDDALPRDSNYQQAVEDLKASDVWRSNADVREWLENKWLSIPQVRYT